MKRGNDLNEMAKKDVMTVRAPCACGKLIALITDPKRAWYDPLDDSVTVPVMNAPTYCPSCGAPCYSTRLLDPINETPKYSQFAYDIAPMAVNREQD